MALAVSSVALAGCPKKETSKPDIGRIRHDAATPTPTDAVARTPKHPSAPAPATYDPSARAKQILDAQIAALKKPADEEDSTLLASFDADAVLLVANPRPVKHRTRGFRDAIARRAPHEDVKDVRYTDLVAGGNANALWFTCTLTIQQDKGVETVRVTELATAESSWKVAAAAFTEADDPHAGKQAPAPFENATKAGPLTVIVADPVQLAHALEPSAIVTGFIDRFASSGGAQDFMAGLPGMTVENAPREVHGDGWGYTIAQLSYEGGRKYPLRVSALVIAVPDGEGGWRVVALHYGDA